MIVKKFPQSYRYLSFVPGMLERRCVHSLEKEKKRKEKKRKEKERKEKKRESYALILMIFYGLTSFSELVAMNLLTYYQ